MIVGNVTAAQQYPCMNTETSMHSKHCNTNGSNKGRKLQFLQVDFDELCMPFGIGICNFSFVVEGSGS